MASGGQGAVSACPLARSDLFSHQVHLQPLDGIALLDRMCELNVVEQVQNVCQTTVVQDAWQRSQELSVHGFVYSIHDGLLRDLHISVSGCDELAERYQSALTRLTTP